MALTTADKTVPGGLMGIVLREDSVVVDRPVAQVFAFVTNPANDPQWHTTVAEVRQTSPGPVAVGTTFVGMYDSRKRTLATPVTVANLQAIQGVVVELEPNRSSRLRVRFVDQPRGFGARILGPVFDLTFRFEGVAGATRVYRGGEINPVSWIRPLLPLLLAFNGGRGPYLLGLLRDAIERLPATGLADDSAQ